MKKIAFITTALVFLLNIKNNAQVNFQWAKVMGGALNDESRSIATDASGNVYTTGYFQGTVDFDPGAGVFNLTSAGGFDIFVSKLDASGNFVWAKAMGGTGGDVALALALDASGNVYTTGQFIGGADFDPGAPVSNLISVGGGEIFVSKLDASGNFVWAKAMGGSGNEVGNSIAIDATGNVYTTGSFEATADFDPSGTVYNLVATGLGDIFVSKLDASGNFAWAKRMGAGSYDQGNGIAVDVNSNVYTIGNFGGMTDFDPGLGTFNLIPAGGWETFISKLDVSGNFVWAKALGGTSDDIGWAISVDLTGNVYSTGSFSTTADFDPSAGVFTITSSGATDIFVSKLDVSGNFVWAKAMGGAGGEQGNGIIHDASGNVYSTGSFSSSTADFDPGAGTFNLTPGALSDIYISKLDASGNFVWAKAMGGTGQDKGYGIALSTSDNVYTTGTYSSSIVDFDPGPGVNNLTSFGGTDFFVHKMQTCVIVDAGLNQSICAPNCAVISGTSSTGSGVWSSSGTGTFSPNNSTLNVTYCPSSSDILAGSVTISLTSTNNGTCLAAVGMKTITIQSANIVGQVTTNTITPVAGKVVLFKYRGALLKCDSITYQNIDVAGNYTFSSIPSGTYIVQARPSSSTLQVTYGNSATYWKSAPQIIHGCVSNATQNINVIPLTNVGLGPCTLTGKIVEGLKYGQKGETVVPGGPVKGVLVKCGKNPGGNSVDQVRTNPLGEYTFATLPVNAANESYFILVDIPGLDTNGTYHVVLTNTNTTINNLDFVADSAKVNPLIFVGLKEFETKNAEIKIYPNPSNGIINFELKIKNNSEIKISVMDVYGKEVQKYYSERMNEKFQMNLGNLSEGIYFLNVVIGDERRTEKLILIK